MDSNYGQYEDVYFYRTINGLDYRNFDKNYFIERFNSSHGSGRITFNSNYENLNFLDKDSCVLKFIIDYNLCEQLDDFTSEIGVCKSGEYLIQELNKKIFFRLGQNETS